MNDAIERVRVKNQILSVIKMHGSQTAVDLAIKLQVSPMAIRQHMQTLQDEQLVTYSEQKQAVGRPVKFWQLTDKANALFPNHHADLVVKLIDGVRKVFGEAGLGVLIGERTQAQIQTYSAQMQQAQNWRERVAILSQLRTQEGYMAEIIEESPGVLLLAENHCSICAAAKSCSQLCSSELQVFETLLGSDVDVERVEHILSGDRRCAYRISGCH